MIADKILPSFYLIDLVGEVANLEFILGERFKIQKITAASLDFKSDTEAINAAEDAVEFMLSSTQLTIAYTQDSCKKQFNPEFYPTLTALEVSDEVLELEELTQLRAIELAGGDPNVSTSIITKRFDEIGDFIFYKMKMDGDNFDVSIRVGANPHKYILAKQEDQQEQAERHYGRIAKVGELRVH